MFTQKIIPAIVFKKLKQSLLIDFNQLTEFRGLPHWSPNYGKITMKGDCNGEDPNFVPIKKKNFCSGNKRSKGSFPFVPPVRYAPPITEHVSLHGKSLCKKYCTCFWGVQIICTHLPGCAQKEKIRAKINPRLLFSNLFWQLAFRLRLPELQNKMLNF